MQILVTFLIINRKKATFVTFGSQLAIFSRSKLEPRSIKIMCEFSEVKQT